MKMNIQNLLLLYLIFLTSAFLIFTRAKYFPKGNKNYLSKKNMDIIKGYSALMIILHHVSINIVNVPVLHALFSPVGAICCGMFLFCSGYGVCYSLNKNGGGYLKPFLAKRVGKILLCFTIVYAMDLLLRFFLFGERYSVIGIMKCYFSLSLVHKVPIPQWFAVCIILFYLYFYIVAKKIKNKTLFYLLLLAFAPVYIVVCMLLGKQNWWFNSAICLDIGILSFLQREKIFELYKTRKRIVLLLYGVLFCALAIIGLFYVKEGNWLESIGIREYMFFCFFNFLPFIVTSYMILFLLNFDLNANFFKMLSPYTFEIYLTQNISSYLLLGVSAKYKIKSGIWVLVHILLTLVLSFTVNKLGVLSRKIYQKYINLIHG